eukprot:3096628-Lingulodinium_polyedra.AAC.1
MHAVRTTRPDWGNAVLQTPTQFSVRVSRRPWGVPWTSQQWHQAMLAFSRGGLGFRSAQRPALAAYLVSQMVMRDLCHQLDQAYAWASDDPGDWLVFAGPEHCAPRVERAQMRGLLDGSATVDKARLFAVSGPHVSGWQAQPAESFGQRWARAVFVADEQVWLGARAQNIDGWCFSCGKIMDTRGHRVFVRVAGGVKDVCHGNIRDH